MACLDNASGCNSALEGCKRRVARILRVEAFTRFFSQIRIKSKRKRERNVDKTFARGAPHTISKTHAHGSCYLELGQILFEHLPMSPNEARHGSHHCMQDMALASINDLHGNTGMLFVMMSESIFIAARNTI